MKATEGYIYMIDLSKSMLTFNCDCFKLIDASPLHAAVIPLRKYPIPSELGSQTWLGSISTGMRDLLGTPSAAVFCLSFHHGQKEWDSWKSVEATCARPVAKSPVRRKLAPLEHLYHNNFSIYTQPVAQSQQFIGLACAAQSPTAR